MNLRAAPLLFAAAFSLHAQSAHKFHGAPISDAPASAPVAAPVTNAPQTTGGIINADFEKLASFTFKVPDMTASNHITIADAEKQIPAPVKSLDGKEVRVRGFMMPIKEVQGKTTEFLITRGQPSCCFSGATEITEFVTVKIPSPGVETMLDDPISIEGKLHVGAVTDSGFIVGLYQLDGLKVIPPGK